MLSCLGETQLYDLTFGPLFEKDFARVALDLSSLKRNESCLIDTGHLKNGVSFQRN